MKSIMNKSEEKPVKNKSSKVVIANKLKITRDKFDRYGNLISRKEQ